MGLTALNKLLTEGNEKQLAFNKAKKELEQWDNKFRQYFKSAYQEQEELIQSPKDLGDFYKE